MWNKIVVEVHWSDKNYNCGWAYPGIGTVIVAEKSLESAKQAFKEALEFHIEGMLEDGDDVPLWLSKREYEIEYRLHISAILRSVESYTTMAALSRATGINQRQLSHYASSLREPRPEQRERIIAGLHKIGNALLSVN